LDRYATAAAVAEATYSSATKAIIVSGENFADGLSASVLSGAASAPVFLTQQAALPAVTAAAMGRVMGANKTVYIIGGENAVGAGVATTLTGLGYTVTRVSGADRAATAVAVATKAKDWAAVGTHAGLNTAIVVNDSAWADAVVAGGLSEASLYPILMTNSDSLTASTSTALGAGSLNIKQVIIVGGTSAVSSAVETEILATQVSSVIRVGGTNRQDTAKLMAEKLTGTVASGGWAWAKTKATIVTSNNFADALASAQFNGTNNSVLLYAADSVPTETNAYVSSTAVKAALTNIYAIGGTSVISATVMQAVDDAGTYAKAVPTITAVEGGNTIVVTFPDFMTSAGMVLANVKINNAAIDNTQTTALSGAFAVENANGTIGLVVGAHTLEVGNYIGVGIDDGGTAMMEGPKWIGGVGDGGAAAVRQPTRIVDIDTLLVTVEGTLVVNTQDNGDINSLAAACAKATANTPLTTGYKKMTCYLDTSLSAGDVITVSTVTDLATATAMTATSLTIANDTTDPSVVSQVHYSGALDESYITFNGPVKGFICGDLVETSAATCSKVSPINGTNTWIITWGANLIAGETIGLGASKVTSANGEVNALASSLATVQTSAANPVATKVTGVTAHTVSATGTYGTAEDIKITAIAGTASQGVYGNLYKVAFVDVASSKGKVDYISSSKTFNLSYDVDDDTLGPNAVEMAAVMNAHATFSSLFTAAATETADTGWDAAAAVAATLTTAGVTTFTATVTFNEQLLPSSITCEGVDLNTSSVSGADIAAAACNSVTTGNAVAALANSMTVVFTLNTASHAAYNYPAVGSTVIEVGTDAADDLQDLEPLVLNKLTLQ